MSSDQEHGQEIEPARPRSNQNAESAIEIVRVEKPVSLGRLEDLADRMSGGLVKAVVDVDREIMAVGGLMHSDEEAVLLDNGSSQADLWGINFYPEEHGTDDFIEFDSMINLRPGQGNRSRSVEDAAMRTKIGEIVDRLVE